VEVKEVSARCTLEAIFCPIDEPGVAWPVPRKRARLG
jgi:hypothetical protein